MSQQYEISLFFNLPCHIQKIIYEFDSTYKELFDTVLEDLPLEAVISRINSIYLNYHRENGYDSLIEGFTDSIQDPDFVLKTLKKCDCCHLDKKQYFQISNKIHNKDICNCLCHDTFELIYYTFFEYATEEDFVNYTYLEDVRDLFSDDEFDDDESFYEDSLYGL